MAILIELLLLAAAMLAIGIAAFRALVVFELTIKEGKLVRARGRIPQALLNDLLGVCPHGHATTLTIRCHMDQGRARLVTRGPIDDDSIQRMRNLLALWPLVRLKTAPKLRL